MVKLCHKKIRISPEKKDHPSFIPTTSINFEPFVSSTLCVKLSSALEKLNQFFFFHLNDVFFVVYPFPQKWLRSSKRKSSSVLPTHLREGWFGGMKPSMRWSISHQLSFQFEWQNGPSSLQALSLCPFCRRQKRHRSTGTSHAAFSLADAPWNRSCDLFEKCRKSPLARGGF